MIFKLKKKKGGILMPKDMIKDLIGKKVQVAVFNDAFVTTGELVSVEGNWIKVDTKKQIKLINADHIQTIVVSK